MLARSGGRTATAALADTALYVQEKSRGWTVELLDELSVISNDFIAGELGIYGTKGRLVRVYPYAELKLINPSPAITIMPNTVFKYHPGKHSLSACRRVAWAKVPAVNAARLPA